MTKLSEAAPTTPDPIEIAMEAEAEGVAPEGVAHEVLRRQSALLSRQSTLTGWEIADKRAGFGLKVLTGLAAVSVAVALGVMCWEARQARGVVVEPFAVPTDLAERGLSGQVVAAQVLDEMVRIQTETPTTDRDARELRDAASQEIKVAIPSTGVSLGDLQAALRSWLGQEIHVTGEVYRSHAGALALRVRIPGKGTVRVEGAEAQLETLTQQAARDSYRRMEPIRYIRWIGGPGGDPAAALAMAQSIAEGSGPPDERAAGYNAWGYWLNTTGQPHRAAQVQRQALQLRADLGNWWSQLGLYEGMLGHAEASYALRAKGLKLRGRGRQGYAFEAAELAWRRADMPEALRQANAYEADPRTRIQFGAQADWGSARARANLHEIAAAVQWAANPRFVQPSRGLDLERRMLAAARIYTLFAAEDWASIVAEQDKYEAVKLHGVTEERRIVSQSTYMVAIALAKTGGAEGARRIVARAPADCLPCLYYGAWALASVGDVATSERMFASAGRQSPTLPQAWFYWGRARLERGDAAGALPMLRAAQSRTPTWADPWKFSGDAEASVGRWAAADSDYRKAEPLAPKWGGLHLKWGEALAKLGKAEEARAKWRAAATMDLSAPDRAALKAHGV